jgi:hypothetical protein
LESPIVNSCNFRIVPADGLWTPGSDEALKMETTGGRQTARPQVRGASVAKAFSPCQTRFAVYVTEAGDLYPCLGLVGCDRWRMGSIDERPEKSRFAKKVALAVLTEWHNQGLTLSEEPKTTAPHQLPRVCVAHRQLEAHNDDAK